MTTMLDRLRTVASLTVDLAEALAEIPDDREAWREALTDLEPQAAAEIQDYLLHAAQSLGSIRERFLYLNHRLEVITWTLPT